MKLLDMQHHIISVYKQQLGWGYKTVKMDIKQATLNTAKCTLEDFLG
jgi:hypothetical protein